MQQPQIAKPNRKRRKKRTNNFTRQLLILLCVTPFGCLCAILLGLGISWYAFPTRILDMKVADLSQPHADEVVLMVAADYANYKDLKRVQSSLNQLKVANKAQYVSLVAERLMKQHRGPVSEDIKNVVILADALNVSTSAMIAYIASPTITPSPTPLPTDTATATLVVPPTEPPTATPVPTETPPPTETAVPPTDTPVPPTATAVPVVEEAVIEAPPPTAEPDVAPAEAAETEPTTAPEFDFMVKKQRLFTKEENGGCLGRHQIFIDIIDANGNPLQGVEVGDTWGNPGPKTGHKGADMPGRAEIDLFKNGFHIMVRNDPSAGRPVTSQQTGLLSSNDWEIGIPRLIEAGYCPNQGTCEQLWNSGVFGVGNNSLCWGHYSWEVIFQRSW